MTTLLRYQQRAGRFGRAVPSEDVETSAPRTPMPKDETAGYVIDADAVAEAIIARLVAGRTFPPGPAARD